MFFLMKKITPPAHYANRPGLPATLVLQGRVRVRPFSIGEIEQLSPLISLPKMVFLFTSYINNFLENEYQS